MLLYLLIGLLPVAAIAYIFWAHRKKAANHANAREERLAMMLGASRQRHPPAAAAPAVPATHHPPLRQQGPPPYRIKSRMLTQPHAVLFYLLKSALPEHEIFVHFNLAGVIEVAPQATGAERDEWRRAISQLTVDCAVCSKAMGVMVAIDLVPSGTVAPTFKSRCLAAAGVRYLQIDPARLPRRGSVRELILGRPY
ncbi:MAG: DUF2726 domain-containing protein [Betaproteobacteria bacterium]|nr:DUF2726 domain-containing protein [Betaproteobacteria bacterium]